MSSRKIIKPRSAQRRGIDWEAVRLAWGMAALVGGVGALIVWATLTAPAGQPGLLQSRIMSPSYMLVRSLPQSVTGKLAVGFGSLCCLFALVVFVMGCAEFFKRRN
jgi:hypothetical protein